MTVNLMGPIIINTKDMKASQSIVDNEDYPVKFPIYDILKKNKEAKG
jgi:flagellar assembly factor FliW